MPLMTLLEKAEEIKRKSLILDKLLRLVKKQDFIDFYLDLRDADKARVLMLFDALDYDALMTLYRTNAYDRMTVRQLRVIAVQKGIGYPNLYDKWTLIHKLEKKDADLEAANENGTLKGPGYEVATASQQ